MDRYEVQYGQTFWIRILNLHYDAGVVDATLKPPFQFQFFMSLSYVPGYWMPELERRGAM